MESSHLACIGLPVDGPSGLAPVLEAVLPEAITLGEVEGMRLLRWQDPSGVRLVLGIAGGQLRYLLPSYAHGALVRLGDLRLVNEDVATAAVLDADGEQLTSLAVELEERRLIRPDHGLTAATVSLVALGTEVAFFDTVEDYERSEAAPLPLPADVGAPEVRWASESFLSPGLFGDPSRAEAGAWLSGTVLGSQRRTVALTGRDVLVVRVRTAGFEVTACLEGDAHPEPPPPGGVMSGRVFLTATLEPASLEPAPPDEQHLAPPSRRRLVGGRRARTGTKGLWRT